MKKITSILICIIVIIASVIVGTPLKENTQIISIITLAIFILYIILYKIIIKKQAKEIIKKINIIDICIAILCLCPFIPIIFGTAVNIEDSLNMGRRYITLLLIYITSKQLVSDNEKYKQYITTTLIIAGVISAIIGFDNMTFKYFLDPLYSIGVPFVINIENRMFGNFGYANTFAISMLIPLLLCIDRNTKKEKTIYNAINFLFIAGIILSYSKAVYIIAFVSIIIYCILTKDLQKGTKTIINITIEAIYAVVYAKIFTTLYQENNDIGIWIVLMEFIAISTITIMIVNKFMQNKNFTIKKVVRIFLIFMVFVLIFVIIGLNLKSPLVMFEKSTQTEQVKYKISNISANTKYEFVFNIEARSLYNNKIYTIQVIEEDEHYQTIVEHEIKVNTYLGEKTIEFTTTENTVEIALVFKSSNSNEQMGLIINDLSINGEEYILNYKYLPASVVNKIKNFSLGSLSVTERFTYYKDAIKLIKLNLWTGIGGNGWVYKYEEVRSYEYSTSQVHSYPIQIFLEFGIIAIIDFIVLIGVLIKAINRNSKGIAVALFAVMLHSMVDFNLSFMNILIYTFLLISIISAERKKDE